MSSLFCSRETTHDSNDSDKNPGMTLQNTPGNLQDQEAKQDCCGSAPSPGISVSKSIH